MKKFKELNEGRPSQRHPLEGHEYHRKTDAELIGIAKDAHKAAEAMKGHNTQAENKYRDQANDSATVRYYRQKNGMPDWYKKKYGHMKEKTEEVSEQHREKGRFKPIVPHNVSSTPGGTPRETSDSANVKLREAVKDKYDIGEYDQEGDMAKSDLRSIIANAQKLHDMIDDADNLPEWCQNKITLAEDYISTVTNYMTAEMSEAFGYARFQKNYKKITGKTPEERVREIEDMQKRMAQQRADYEAELASRKMKKEEVEKIDEVSSSTLSNYIGKASKDKSKDRKPGIDKAYYKMYINAIKKDYQDSSKRGMSTEEVELEEENKPTNPELWARAKALAKQKFDVYPSAYANGWAAKWYKSKGGGWRSVNEENEKPPFEPSKKPVKKSTPGKYGRDYSTVRILILLYLRYIHIG